MVMVELLLLLSYVVFGDGGGRGSARQRHTADTSYVHGWRPMSILKLSVIVLTSVSGEWSGRWLSDIVLQYPNCKRYCTSIGVHKHFERSSPDTTQQLDLLWTDNCNTFT